MTEPAVRLPVKSGKETPARRDWWPMDNLRRQLGDLIEDFDRGFLRSPFRGSLLDVEPFLGRELTWASAPAVDIVDKDTAYEITAELPGLDENNIDVKVANGMLTIKGEKKEEKEEKKRIIISPNADMARSSVASAFLTASIQTRSTRASRRAS